MTAYVTLSASVRAGLRTGFVRQRSTADSITVTGHAALSLTVSLHRWNASRERGRDRNVLGGTCVYFCCELCVCVFVGVSGI